MLALVRLFFEKKGVLEVDCPALLSYPAIDAHIDSMQVQVSEAEVGYLHTSPEYAMKRLLSEGSGDIFQLGHVYRQEEQGRLHHPEFTMIEWYRLGFSLDQMIEETIELIQGFLGPVPKEVYSYEEIFQKHLQISAEQSSLAELEALSKKLGHDLKLEDRDSYLHLLLSHEIEPQLGKDHLTVVYDYPASQAALSQIKTKNGINVAERFEIYHKGIELANGYHELLCAQEQKKRFETENQKREKLGKDSYPVDIGLLQALEKGLPDCCGVSVGFDRLIYLQSKKKTIQDILPVLASEEK